MVDKFLGGKADLLQTYHSGFTHFKFSPLKHIIMALEGIWSNMYHSYNGLQGPVLFVV